MAVRHYDVDYRDIYCGRVRAIEELYSEIHQDLLAWGQWGKDRYPGRPRLMLSGIWKLPGDTDPDRDPEAAPSVKPDPIDERMVIVLDQRIHQADFPSAWWIVLKVNYIPPKLKHGTALHILPEYQRPEAARMSAESFIEQLSNALEFLRR